MVGLDTGISEVLRISVSLFFRNFIFQFDLHNLHPSGCFLALDLSPE
jgi:hypothetical protein